jgi:hypothetical protein
MSSTGAKPQALNPQVLDAFEETRAAGQAQLQTFKERLEQVRP